MPRAGQLPASTLRNRNRITNKTRLKIVHGNIDEEPIIPDEDEEKNRLLQSVAGVDLEDANEHHLQQVLSEAASKSHEEQAVAFIPIPEATGVADNYESLYPTDRWKDPVSYIQSTSVIEEYTLAGLADGCTYYMDERDKEWLDRNNEEARGEGTSAQGSVLTSSGRVSARSAKAKGKEPEELYPIPMSEDEFELAMGLFEKITQEKTEFLHHSLESGQNHFPEFSEYQQVLSVPLPPSTFASYAAPSWLPQPSHLLRLGRIIYPYWKERCLERAGRRIIPPLNFDEADTLNESYVCFRRRETKAVRKTRASQVTSSDKLVRLQSEFEYPLQLAKQLLAREQMKRDSARQSQVVWNLRMKLVEMKVKNPTLGDKADEELLVDRERKPTRVRLPVKSEHPAQPTTPARDILRPKERQTIYQSKIDALLQAHKEQDQQWEDHIDTGYVSTFQPYSSRLFKYINPSERSKRPPPDPELNDSPVPKRPVRIRRGRGGRTFIDRRPPASHTSFVRRRRLPILENEEEPMDVDQQDEDPEADRRLVEKWRFDADDGPSYGSEEQDRVLVDDYDVKYMSRVVTLLGESDYNTLTTDPTITRIAADGKREFITPFRLGVMTPVIKGSPSRAMSVSSQHGPAGSPNGAHVPTPVHQGVALSQQLKVPPSASTQVASGSGVVHTPSSVPASTPTAVIPSPQVTHNGRAAMNMPRVDMVKLVFNSNAASTFPQKMEDPQMEDQQHIPRPKSQQQVHMQQPHQQEQAQAQAQVLASVNGLHPAYAALVNANPAAYNLSHYTPHPYSTNPVPSGLNNQQVQHLKSVFNAANTGSMQNYNSALFAQMQMPKNTNTNTVAVNGTSAAVPSSNGNLQHMQNLTSGMNVKLPPVRQMQQRVMSGNSVNGASPSPPRPPSTVNGVQQHGQATNSPSPRMRPVNGIQGGAQMGQGQHQILQLHSQSPKPMSYISNGSPPQSYSSPKIQPTSNLSPTLTQQQQQQQQQQVTGGNSQGVY